MYRINYFYFPFFIFLLYTNVSAQTVTVKQYIDLYKNVAMREMITFKIPASITLAQGLLESGSGNSRLAVNGNNHFGIKCKKEWTGCTILEDDDALQECFRCYTSVEESYKDHSKFLKENKRYAKLFELEITNYSEWAAGLLSAGYATNQKYTTLLISCIERNKLAQYDSMVIDGYNPFEELMPANIDIVNTKNIPTTVVQPDQSLEVIAIQNHKTEKKLSKYNDLDVHHISPGDVLYLKPKKRKAGVATHTVMKGEDMWLISQKYAIRLNSLYKKNLMDKGTEAVPGSVLQLQHKAEMIPDTNRQVKEQELKNTKLISNTNNTVKLDNQVIHTVLAGETLYSISKLYGVSVADLLKVNQLTNNSLTIGQKLIIANILPSNEIFLQTITHTVKSGETLYSISKLYKVSIQELKKWNNLTLESIAVGQILIIR